MLIKLVFFSFQIYWSLIFFLPSEIYKEINDKLRDFFWVGFGLKRNKAKITLDEIYVLKDEGGLGLMRCKDWNNATIARHVWNLTFLVSNSI